MTDLISRQAAIKWVKTECNPYGKPTLDLESGKKVIEYLKHMSPAQQWHPITSRPMDEEERECWKELRGYTLEDDETVIYSGTPDDGDEVLVCTAGGNVFIDTFYSDPDNGCYFEENGDMDGIVAWMPLPKPYKAERSEDGKYKI